MDNDKLLIKDENDEVKEYTILSVVNLNNSSDDYAIFTDYSVNENGEINVFSGILDPNGQIRAVENESDIKALDSYIASL